MTTTTRIETTRFAWQMAEQARKFGGRIAELRRDHQWTGRQLVERMESLGDKSLNTNQLSRYEHGGAMPGEQRQEWFATALDTTVADLHAGPVADRVKRSTPDILGTLSPTPDLASIHRKLDAIMEHLGIVEDDEPTLEDAPEIGPDLSDDPLAAPAQEPADSDSQLAAGS